MNSNSINLSDPNNQLLVNEEFFGTDGNDTLNGTANNDTIDGAGGDDFLVGSGGDDLIIGGAGNDSITGGGQGESFFTVGGRDTLAGGLGNDTYIVTTTAGGGTVIFDEEGDADGVFIVAENSDLSAFGTLDPNISDEEATIIAQDPNIWRDSFIELSNPQQGTVGIAKSDTDLIIDINRDGVAEAENDVTIVNYFDEQGNIGAGAPLILNNLTGREQEVVDFFENQSDSDGGGENDDTTGEFSEEFVGTDGNDTLEGTVNNDSIDGGAGNDFLVGSGGDDLIIGGAGNDSIVGGGQGEFAFSVGGRDTLAGGLGNDTYLVTTTAGGGTIVFDEEGSINVVAIVAENSDLNAFVSLDLNTGSDAEALAIFQDPNTWGDSFIELSNPQQGIVGIAKSETDLIIDINRDGLAEAENDVTIVNYFDEQGNIGAGAPLAVNNLTGREQEIVNFFRNQTDSDVGGESSSANTVYRFFNNDTGVHFYTANEIERDAVENLANYTPEGASYEAVDPLTGGSTPVYRFLNEDTGVHLYTVSEVERDATENLSNFSFEGEAFSAYATQVDGSIPIYRFFNSTTGAHFYTPSEGERNAVENNLPEFDSEGIAYYALPSDF